MATAADSSKTLTTKRKTNSDTIMRDNGTVLHEGWAIKESGTAMFGKTNWRKRWFRLVKRGDSSTLEYYKSTKDKIPAGYVRLDISYCTRQVEDKTHPNCFAIGPLLEDGATRTYYISCSNRLIMQEWIAVIDGAIQGMILPEQIHKRRATVNKVFAMKYSDKLKQIKERINDQSIVSEEMDASLEDSTVTTAVTTVSNIGTLLHDKLTCEVLSDDEMMDELEDDIIQEEEEAESNIGGTTPTISQPELTLHERLQLYNNPLWRLQQWDILCDTVKSINWTHTDTRDGVTIARAKFGKCSHALIKIEGILTAEPKNVYQFLCTSTKEGGKLDYMFRNEYIVEQLSGDEPYSTVIYNEFQPPLPRLSKRDIVAMKIWVPPTLTHDGKTGLVMFSVSHPFVNPPQEGYTRISLDTSGCILSPYPAVESGGVHTKMTVFVQVGFHGAMHKMLKGAYNSGLLKLGFRTTFTFISEQLDKYIKVTNI